MAISTCLARKQKKHVLDRHNSICSSCTLYRCAAGIATMRLEPRGTAMAGKGPNPMMHKGCKECGSCRVCAYGEILEELWELGLGQFLAQRRWGDIEDLSPKQTHPFHLAWPSLAALGICPSHPSDL